MLDQVKATIEKYGLIRPKSRIAVGFSGGIDSVCLLHLLSQLTEYGLELWALYINHALRPEENLQEIDLLNRVGLEWGVHTRQMNIDIPAHLERKKQSLQLLARQERYKAFEAFRTESRIDRIALAHHRDDQAETVLYRIIRGTGLEGLAGMPVIRDQFYIRPFLEISRADIMQYAAQHRLSWIEDSSNQKLIYQRNRIRLQLLPQLESGFNPRVKESLLRLAQLAQEQSGYLEAIAAENYRKLIKTEDQTVKLELGAFLDLHTYLQYILLKKALSLVKPLYRIESAPLLKLRERLNREKNKFKSMVVHKGIGVAVRENWIVFGCRVGPEKRLPLEAALLVPGTTEIAACALRIRVQPATPPLSWGRVSAREIYIDAAQVVAPLRIRFWKAGDRFRPLGAPGSQKLHDFFINTRISRHLRGRIPLLVNGDGRIIWVMGLRLSDEFKLTAATREVWQVSYISGEEDSPAKEGW